MVILFRVPRSAFRVWGGVVISLSGKKAFVTGGGRGIGRATAALLEKAGARVAVGYKNRKPDVPLGIAGDLGDLESANHSVEQAVRALGGLDILIVNHGVWPEEDVPLHEMEPGRWSATLRTNLDAMFYVIRAAVPHMPAGRIVLVSSTAGQRGEAYHADYAASKGAVISLTKSLAVELAPRILVNCVAPGWVDTEMAAKAYAQETGNGKREIERTIPLGRVASAEDIAGPIVFLCSDLAAHITGEILNVNGGSVLCG
jgi:3-oxoacyl-[acyl-carrier protein] reductase